MSEVFRIRYSIVSHSHGPTFVVLPQKDFLKLMEAANMTMDQNPKPSFCDLNEAMHALAEESDLEYGSTQ